MKVKYWEDADLLSIRLSKKPFVNAEQEGDVIVHYSQNEEPVLIEILNAGKFLRDTAKSLPNKLQKEIWASLTS